MSTYEKCREITNQLESLLNATHAVMRVQHKALNRLDGIETRRPLTDAEEAQREKLGDSLEVLGTQADMIDRAICFLTDVPRGEG